MLDLMFDIHGLLVEDYYKITIEIENVIANYKFKNELVEYLWVQKGNDRYWKKISIQLKLNISKNNKMCECFKFMCMQMCK